MAHVGMQCVSGTGQIFPDESNHVQTTAKLAQVAEPVIEPAQGAILILQQVRAVAMLG